VHADGQAHWAGWITTHTRRAPYVPARAYHCALAAMIDALDWASRNDVETLMVEISGVEVAEA
jgi:hypothetical protein